MEKSRGETFWVALLQKDSLRIRWHWSGELINEKGGDRGKIRGKAVPGRGDTVQSRRWEEAQHILGAGGQGPSRQDRGQALGHGPQHPGACGNCGVSHTCLPKGTTRSGRGHLGGPFLS